MANSIRIDRLNQQLQREIALILQHELKDPRLGFVTIIQVELSNDLSHAKVLYSCLGSPEDRARSQEALDDAAGFVRSLIKRRLRIKTTPEIVFRYDDAMARAMKTHELLDELKRQAEGSAGASE